MLRTKPKGKYNMQVCTNMSCMLRGGDEILEHCKKKLGVGHKDHAGRNFLSKRSNASAPAAGLLRCR